MELLINPFNDPFVTETMLPEDFVQLFSPGVLTDAEPLFLPGNVVLVGVEGTGKSMLLALLKPEVRLAYRRANVAFPIPRRLSRFIGAGISLTRSGIMDIGQRQMIDRTFSPDEFALYFGDYLNNFVLLDLLESIEKYQTNLEGVLAKELNMTTDSATMDAFAAALGKEPCWYGYYASIKSLPELKARIRARIDSYLKYFSFDVDEFPRDIQDTKTSIGEPISRAVVLLRNFSVVPGDLQFFIRVDQLETLSDLEALARLGPSYRAVVNKALGLRNPNVSYRIGTRHYAWQSALGIHGTAAALERDRDFKLLDLDQVFRRTENPRTWVFRSFAEDVFTRRLKKEHLPVAKKRILASVFSTGLRPTEKARIYCGDSSKDSVKPRKDWADSWKRFLFRLAESDPLSARLADAWARQKHKADITKRIPRRPYEWERSSKKYWKKERIQHALMQIAGRCRQRLVWAGEQEILGLSGGNILMFVLLCQHIWSAYLRTIRDKPQTSSRLPKIDWSLQAVGILDASTSWFRKIADRTGGHTRQRFISYLGNALEKQLYDDLSLSYPGANGFSVRFDELEAHPRTKAFLTDLVDHGVLLDLPHTTKLSDRRARRKYYLVPLLCPYFRIPHIRTKEPLYVDIHTVEGWMANAEDSGGQDSSTETKGHPRFQSNREVPPGNQRSLFE